MIKCDRHSDLKPLGMPNMHPMLRLETSRVQHQIQAKICIPLIECSYRMRLMLLLREVVKHLKKPVVRCTPSLKLQGAQGVGDVLQSVHQAVRVVVTWVDAPAVARMWVPCKLDSIGNQVPHDSNIILVITTHPAHSNISCAPGFCHLLLVWSPVATQIPAGNAVKAILP